MTEKDIEEKINNHGEMVAMKNAIDLLQHQVVILLFDNEKLEKRVADIEASREGGE